MILNNSVLDFEQFSFDFNSSVLDFNSSVNSSVRVIYKSNMDVLIRQAVAEELKKQSESKTKESEVNGGEEASTSNPTQRTERTVNRLSGLLNRIRNRGGARANGGASKNRKKPRTDKEHRIQIRWLHYNKDKGKYTPVRNR